MNDIEALFTAMESVESLEEQAKKNPLAFFIPNPGAQKSFWNFTRQEQCFSGGNRSGKSEVGGAKVSKYALANPNKTVWCSTEDFDTSKGVQQLKISKFIPKEKIKYPPGGEYNPQNGYSHQMVVLNNGTKIVFKSYQQGTNAFMGDQVDLIWLDEPPPWSIYVECLMRTLTTKGKILFTFTEWQDGITAIVDRVIIHAKENEIDTVIGSTYENIHIDPKDIKRLEGILLPHEKESRIYGRPVQAAGRVFYLYNDKYHWKPTIKVPKDWIIFEGIDPHNEKPSHWICCGLDIKNKKFWVIESHKSTSIASVFAKEIMEKRKGLYRESQRKFTIIDHSSKVKSRISNTHIFDALVQAGLKDLVATTDAHKKHASGINAVLEIMKVTDKDETQFGVMDRNSGVREELLKHVWDKHPNTRAAEKKDPKNTAIQKWDDFLDPLRYIIMNGAMDYIKYAVLKISDQHTEYVNNFSLENQVEEEEWVDPRIALEEEVNQPYVNWLE